MNQKQYFEVIDYYEDNRGNKNDIRIFRAKDFYPEMHKNEIDIEEIKRCDDKLIVLGEIMRYISGSLKDSKEFKMFIVKYGIDENKFILEYIGNYFYPGMEFIYEYMDMIEKKEIEVDEDKYEDKIRVKFFLEDRDFNLGYSHEQEPYEIGKIALVNTISKLITNKWEGMYEFEFANEMDEIISYKIKELIGMLICPYKIVDSDEKAQKELMKWYKTGYFDDLIDLENELLDRINKEIIKMRRPDGDEELDELLLEHEYIFE